jgi:hypothetical protein
MYAQETNQFQSVSFAIEVYEFADRMQIETLTTELDEMFKNIDATKIFPIFELYISLNKERALFWCKYQVMQIVQKCVKMQ